MTPLPAPDRLLDSRTILATVAFVALLALWGVLLVRGVVVPEIIPPAVAGLYAVLMGYFRVRPRAPKSPEGEE